jgi:hypothetical protein
MSLDWQVSSAFFPSALSLSKKNRSGFDYHFNAIQNENNELFNAYKDMFEDAMSQSQGGLSVMLRLYFPILDTLFVSPTSNVIKALVFERIGPITAKPKSTHSTAMSGSYTSSCGPARAGKEKKD